MITYAFLIFINAVFPTQSDDIGRKVEGIERAVKQYMTWNGRFGELLLVTFGSYFSTTVFYAPVNALIGSCVIMLIFINITGRLPKKNGCDTPCFMVLLAFLLLDKTYSFGSVFYWAAGSFNYLWGWFLILITITPATLFWRGIKFSAKTEKLIFILGIPIGILAGWSSEMGIVIIIAGFASIVYAGIRATAFTLKVC